MRIPTYTFVLAQIPLFLHFVEIDGVLLVVLLGFGLLLTFDALDVNRGVEDLDDLILLFGQFVPEGIFEFGNALIEQRSVSGSIRMPPLSIRSVG